MDLYNKYRNYTSEDLKELFENLKLAVVNSKDDNEERFYMALLGVFFKLTKNRFESEKEWFTMKEESIIEKHSFYAAVERRRKIGEQKVKLKSCINLATKLVIKGSDKKIIRKITEFDEEDINELVDQIGENIHNSQVAKASVDKAFYNKIFKKYGGLDTRDSEGLIEDLLTDESMDEMMDEIVEELIKKL